MKTSAIPEGHFLVMTHYLGPDGSQIVQSAPWPDARPLPLAGQVIGIQEDEPIPRRYRILAVEQLLLRSPDTPRYLQRQTGKPAEPWDYQVILKLERVIPDPGQE